ncbi:MAG: hypothetical protein WC856_27475 [Methylococcaceae bacterium]|jgi:hypothetical protein
MIQSKMPQFGKLPPKHGFVLNPYPDMRITSCPMCESKTGQKKIPLLIHINPMHLIALNYTCRYCRSCDLLIAHKHEIEHLLTSLFSQTEPETVGSEYLIIGTVEKSSWREDQQRTRSVREMLPYASDFAVFHQELRVTSPGWFKTNQDAPVMEPPLSQEWVKSEYRKHQS